MSGEELLELAASIVTALAAMHERMPSIAHGALTPAHIVLRRDGSDADRGRVRRCLQALQRNREHLWRDFGLALPTAANLPRFDQRGDVTQIGAVVLAITQRRSLRRDEYPKGTRDRAVGNRERECGDRSKLRVWLQDALQLHGRVTFASGVEARAHSATCFLRRRSGTLEALALQTAIRQLCGESGSGRRHSLPHLRAS